MKKNGFTLTEMAIVITLVAIVIGTFLNFGMIALDKQKHLTTQNELESIKTSLIAYAASQSKLPYPDIDGDGRGDETFNCVSDNCELPYLDIGAKGKDNFGMPYKYDVSYDLTTTTSHYDLCSKIQSRFNYTMTLPSVVNDAGDNNYSVAAVVLSMGEDKELTGENSYVGVNDRNYAMSQNRYDQTNNNDILLELTPYELLANVCDMVPQYNANNGLEIYASLDNNVSGSAELAGGIITGSANLVTAGGLSYLDFDESVPTEIRISNNKTYIDWTVSIWLKHTNWAENDRQDFINLTNTNGNAINMFIVNGDLRYRNNAATLINTNSNFSGTAWKHIVITQKRLSATQVEMRMYENGIEIYTTTQDGVNYDLNLGDLDLGGVNTNAWDGGMDEFRFYNYALDGGDITQYYDDTKVAHGH